jgi:hypothetical protein
MLKLIMELFEKSSVFIYNEYIHIFKPTVAKILVTLLLTFIILIYFTMQFNLPEQARLTFVPDSSGLPPCPDTIGTPLCKIYPSPSPFIVITFGVSLFSIFYLYILICTIIYFYGVLKNQRRKNNFTGKSGSRL